MTHGQGAPHIGAARAPAAVEVLHLGGCPHSEETVALARSVAARVFPEAEVLDLLLDEADFRERRVPGSPTVRVNGRDIAGREESPGGLIA